MLYFHFCQGFRRTNARNQPEQRALYLPSVWNPTFYLLAISCLLFSFLITTLSPCLNQVLTHRLGSATMLSLIYSEILKMIRLWGLLDFDVEIFYPRDPYSLPRGYPKQESKESDPLHIMTSQSLLMEVISGLFPTLV